MCLLLEQNIYMKWVTSLDLQWMLDFDAMHAVMQNNK